MVRRWRAQLGWVPGDRLERIELLHWRAEPLFEHVAESIDARRTAAENDPVDVIGRSRCLEEIECLLNFEEHVFRNRPQDWLRLFKGGTVDGNALLQLLRRLERQVQFLLHRLCVGITPVSYTHLTLPASDLV